MSELEPKVGPDGQPIQENSEAGTAISKFKTAQDRDNAYLELEKKTRLDSQRLADLEAKLEQLADMSVSQGAPRQEERREFSDEYKNQEQLKQFWSRFASKPDEVFAEREERIINRVRAEMTTRSAIEEFKSKNPDLAKHEELVTIFVQKQPTNLSPAERLKKAAPMARAYLAELAQGASSSKEDSFNSEAFVESPSGSREGAPSKKDEEETLDPLAEAIREHSLRRAATMNPYKK
jgi:polyhydroxyalkanoate synthesis regulator phasin